MDIILTLADARTADFAVSASPVGIHLIPMTQAAQDWTKDNLADPRKIGRGFIIEREYFSEIGEGFTADGLTACPLN